MDYFGWNESFRLVVDLSISCGEGRRIGIVVVVVVVVVVDDLEDDYYLELGRNVERSGRDEDNTAM